MGHPRRAEALAACAQAANALGRIGESVERSKEAIEAYGAAGDVRGKAAAMVAMARTESLRSGSDAVLEILDEAIALLEGLPPGRELVRAYARYAGTLWVVGDDAATRAWADKAVSLARDLGIDDEVVLPLQYRGAARSAEGDPGGLEDLREAISLGRDLGQSEETAIAYNNLAYELWFREGPRAALDVWLDLEAFTDPRGFTARRVWATGGRVAALCDLGEWDQALELVEAVIGSAPGRDSNIGILAKLYAARIRLGRGELDEAASLVEEAAPRAFALGLAEYEAPAHLAGARVEHAQGHADRAIEHVRAFARVTQTQPGVRMLFLTDAVRDALALGLADEVPRLLEGGLERRAWRGELAVMTGRAALAEHAGRVDEAAAAYAEAAAGWAAYGARAEEAFAQLGRARCCERLGRGAERRTAVTAGLRVAQALRARPLVEALEALEDPPGAATEAPGRAGRREL